MLAEIERKPQSWRQPIVVNRKDRITPPRHLDAAKRRPSGVKLAQTRQSTGDTLSPAASRSCEAMVDRSDRTECSWVPQIPSWLNKSTIRTERNVVKRRVPPRAEAIMLVPAGSPVRLRWSRHKNTLYIHLERELGRRWTPRRSRRDPARLTVPPLDGLDLPHLRAGIGSGREASPWRRSRRESASRIKASFARTSIASSASRRGGSGCTQESPCPRPQSPLTSEYSPERPPLLPRDDHVQDGLRPRHRPERRGGGEASSPPMGGVRSWCVGGVLPLLLAPVLWVILP